MKVYSVVVPTNAIVTGDCDHYIELAFFKGWTARFDIEEYINETTNVALNFTLSKFTLTGDYATAPNGTIPKHVHGPIDFETTNLTFVHADIDKSYACVTGNTVIDVKKDEFALRLDALQMQVNTANVTTFAQGEMCEADKKAAATSDLVPIIVGACLALLVIIVLVAYLIGRVRAKRQGYASV